MATDFIIATIIIGLVGLGIGLRMLITAAFKLLGQVITRRVGRRSMRKPRQDRFPNGKSPHSSSA